MKKFLKWLILCLVACFMVVGLVQTAYFVSAEQEEVIPEQDQTDVPVPAHEKSISGSEEEGRYTLILDVKGKQETIPGQKTMVDVVLVIDRSQSMTKSSLTGFNSRMAALKDIITRADGLSQTILGNEKLDARIAVVAYSGSQATISNILLPPSEIKIGENEGAFDDASIESSWVGNYSGDTFNSNAYLSINESVNKITTGGGTNCEAGLIKAFNVLQGSRDEAQKYLICLSDGTPTFYFPRKTSLPPFSLYSFI